MSSPTRWAGVPLADRRAERRASLISAAFDIFGGTGPEAELSVRSVCRHCGFNTRYFYESFTDTDELLGAVYDATAAELAEVVADAMAAAGPSVRARTRAGIRAVLGHASQDPRRGRILFTEGRSNPVLVERRAATQDMLFQLAFAESDPREPDPLPAKVRAAMFTGAMAELAQQYLAGNLGDDLDRVVDEVVETLLPSRRASA
ncbi:TetR family transcriptional regulator [Gordonia paraffinivorans]|uniref:TetR family transcriptional regulator n=1 Tax=Gordonia paraffinivorans NBRC 108238 TaxID=1223543 RepID=A0ABQ0IFS0_9ACTN|nr:TetR/AcrR family transcriptional regulator [Gordonia paraffinivorans]MBY4574779.1 TetR family transcriptional regulator [Gordonia paraffinivorans]PWD44533.1 TetR family transcriptional regulator [Gordonia paraffinivorans]GAC82440.1 putative TetR family transcriptional regulator [Gordonia paraffinivorans NBRC 108238]